MIRVRRKTQSTFSIPGAFHRSFAWSIVFIVGLFLTSNGAYAGTFYPTQTTFPALVVGQTSTPVTVTLTAQASGTATSPIAMTEGTSAAGLAEFTVSDAGTCGANPSLSAGQNCTVSVTFSPRFPGIRHGAILLETSGGQLLASSLVSGQGQGGLPVLIPGQIDTVAGDGQWFYEGDHVPATQAPIYLPSGLAVDGAGNLYLADTINNRVRRVDAVTHIITTVAGNGNAGFQGDQGPAVAAEITSPSGLALDGAGNLYIADTGNNAIRRLDAVSGVITTVAGVLGQAGYSNSIGPAINAKLNAPQGIALTASGDLLIADTTNAAIRVVTMADGQIQTIAGTGIAGYNGDDILATTAQLNEPTGVSVRFDGAIAIADLSNNRIRLITAGGDISTMAGDGTPRYAGDNGPAAQAELQGPAAVAFDPAGDLFVADSVNNCIRFISGSQQIIVTLSGIPSDDRYAGDGGPENQARMHGPDGLFFDAQGNLWLSDRFNNRVREVSGSLLTIGPYPTMKVGKISQPVAEAMINAGNQPFTFNSPVLQQAALDSSTTTCGQGSLAPSMLCNMGVEFSPTNVGPSINGSITWNSNTPNVTPMNLLYGQVLSVEPTAIAITSSTNPGLLGQAVTLLATVTSDDTGRTGAVDFVEGGQTWCSNVSLAANGMAACQIPSLSLGAHNFSANYSGDNNNAASSSPVYVETIKQQAALALSVSTSPAVVTSNVVLSLSAADSYGTPTGTVIFYDGQTALATVTLDSNGRASWSTGNFTVGTHTLSAQYSGDGSNVPGSSNAKALEVDQASTTTVLSSANNNATVGSNVALSANVITSSGPAPTGSVQFFDGSTSLGSGTLTGSSSVSINVSTLAPGNHNVTAVYSGDVDSATSTSATIVQIIQQIGTGTTLSADVDPLNAGATVHLSAVTALALGATADGSLTGIVIFKDGSNVLGSAPLSVSGEATLAVSALNVGSHAIVANFSGNTNYASSNSTALNEIVQKTITGTTLSSAFSTTLMGEPSIFTAVVTSGTGTPTGSVTFTNGAAILGTAALDSSGFSTYTTTAIAAGVHMITAYYNGDSNYLPSNSPAVQQTVTLAQTSLSLSGPTNPIVAGTTAHFVAALTTPGVAPTGTMVLLDGASVLGTAPVNTAGNYLFTTSQLSVGVHRVVVSYSGDANNAAVVSAAIVVTVQQANTQTALVSSANPITKGGTLTLTATVSSDSPNQGGSVSFYDGTAALGTVSLGSDGTAMIYPQDLALGMHSLTAVYSGDTNHATSVSSPLPELVVQSSSIAVTSNVNPSVSGENVLFTALVQGSPTPTGSVLVRDKDLVLATVPLSSTGLATFGTASLGVGVHELSFTYSGDSHFAIAIAQMSQTVLNASTQTTLMASANPAIYGQALTLSASVSSNGGAATGSVSFMDAGAIVGSSQLGANGSADLTLSSLSPGTHDLVAVYVGDGKASPSSSVPTAVTVRQTTVLALASNANPALTLSQVIFTAAVTNPGAAPASGQVTFTDGATTLGSAAVDGTGRATLTVPQLGAGTHAILAVYAGDGANFGSQSAILSEAVQRRGTTTLLTGTPTDTSNPQQITLIAVVNGGGSQPPSGTVNFTSGGVTLGAAPVDATGIANITVIFNTPNQQIVASYMGDASYAVSQSIVTPITAGSPAQFTIALSSPSITLVSHQHTQLAVTVASVKGFTDTIALGCLGLPYAATCTFNTTQLKLLPNGSAITSLILDTGDPLGAGSSTSASLDGRSATLLCFLPAGFALVGLRRRARRKAWSVLLLLLLGVVLSAGVSGCGGLQVSGTPPGTYSFRIIGTGQGSNITEAQTMTLVVTQ